MKSIQVPNEVLIPQVEQLVAKGIEVIIRARGNSMLPYIRGDRDNVVLQRAESVEVGDIVLVRLPGRFVMHRIIEAQGDSFVMMGDGNIRGTESFSREEIIGKVVCIVKPDGRRVIPGKARVWRALLPARRYILGIYRRIIGI